MTMGLKQELVVMSNRLVEASYRLDLVEHRIILLAVVQSRETGRGLNATDFVQITVKDYIAHFSDADESYAYRQLKEASLSLYGRGFVLYDNHPKTGNPRINKKRWVQAVSYSKGVIEIQFTNFIIPYITRLQSEFTSFRLEKIANMSSPYAIRLYEFLIQWGSVGKREIELAWIRKTLMIEDKYASIKDFKKYVIDVAISQINEFSDLTASYTQRKTGRIVTHLIFIFSQKTPPERETKQENEVAEQAKQPLLEPDGKSHFRLAKAPIPPKTQAEYLKLRTGDEIELCIERANEYGSQQEKAGKPVMYGALYRKAIAEGWHEEKAKQKAQQAEDTARKEASRQAVKEAKRIEVEKAERSKMETELSAAWFSALPDDEKEIMGIAYIEESNQFDVGSFKRKGYDYIGFQFFIKRKWLEGGVESRFG
jgi:plasmid replication initiation protein